MRRWMVALLAAGLLAATAAPASADGLTQLVSLVPTARTEAQCNGLNLAIQRLASDTGAHWANGQCYIVNQ